MIQQRKGRHIFITATDTDAGKTFVMLAMLHALQALEIQPHTIKPIACGCNDHGINSDVAALMQAQKLTQTDAINLYTFPTPIAPAQAAALANTKIDRQQLRQWCQQHIENNAYCLIEGIGGLMTPLDHTFLLCDWLMDMPKIEVMLVVRAHLGGINHALLSMEKLRAIGKTPKWVILNDADGAGADMLKSHATAITPFLDHTSSLHCIAHGCSYQHAMNFFQDEIHLQ